LDYFFCVCSRELPFNEEYNVDSASLTKSEKNQVWIYTLLNPLATNLILYYGWRKVFPGKAKEVNRITIPVFIAYIIIGIILLASGLVEIRQG